MVALSLPTLDRVLRRLQAEHLIELGYGRILDRDGLIALSGADPGAPLLRRTIATLHDT